MPKTNHKMEYLKELPEYVVTTQWTRRWSAERKALQPLGEGTEKILVISGLPDKRTLDLCKSAIYSETAKLRERSGNTFAAVTTTHENEDGSFSLYIERRDER